MRELRLLDSSMAILERANWGGTTTCAMCVAAFLAARFDRFSISTETTGGEILVAF